MGKSSRLWRRLLGVLAGSAWLALALVWWASRHPVPSSSTFVGFAKVINDQEVRQSGTMQIYDSGKLIYWDMATGKKLGELDASPPKAGREPRHPLDRDKRSFVLLRKGTALNATLEPNGVQVREMALNEYGTTQPWRDIAFLPVKADSLEFAPDGSALALISVKKEEQIQVGLTLTSRSLELQIWDLTTRTLRSMTMHPEEYFVHFSRNGRKFATQYGNNLIVREAVTGERRGCFDTGWNSWTDALSPGAFLLVQSNSSQITVNEAASGNMLGKHRLKGMNTILDASEESGCLAVQQHGASFAPRWMPGLFAWALYQQEGAGKVLIIDIASGKELASLPRGEVGIFLPDGKTLALYHRQDGTIKLWDVPPRIGSHPIVAMILLPLAIGLTLGWWYLGRKMRHAEETCPPVLTGSVPESKVEEVR
jgi:WD40 repeat protein